jgi:hypothetical protein
MFKSKMEEIQGDLDGISDESKERIVAHLLALECRGGKPNALRNFTDKEKYMDDGICCRLKHRDGSNENIPFFPPSGGFFISGFLLSPDENA